MPYGRGANLLALPASYTVKADLASLIARATILAQPVLAARGQTLVLASAPPPPAVERRSSRLCALLACAIHELSGCTMRGGRITCTLLHDGAMLRGENPIIMPDHALALDWIMLMRAKALGVRPILEWEQGRGPLLTLILPVAQEQAETGRAFAGRCQPA
jgi:hypothetical protein